MNRPLPQNIEAEQAVLGAILIEGDVLNQVLNILSTDDFYKDAHKKIFDAMVSMHNDETPIDVLTIFEYMESKGNLLEEVGGSPYITYLTAVVPTVENIECYSKIVKDASKKRSVVTELRGLEYKLLKGKIEPGDVIRQADEKINALEIGRNDLSIMRKPRIHPAVDLLDGKLIFGIPNGKNPVFICDRRVINVSEIERIRTLEQYPQHSNFSPNGIQRYLEGETNNPIELYITIKDLLSKHVKFQYDWQIDVTVIWIMGTYLYPCFQLFPYYWVQSPTKRCGKTKLLELMASLCFNSNGVETAPSEAVLFRLASLTGETLLWDEAENLIKQKEKGDLISILNTAYRKGGNVSRCDGKDYKVKRYATYRPIALSGISSLPDTVSDRTLKIELLRKRRDEKTTRLQPNRTNDKLQKIRDDLHIFALVNAKTILEAYDQFKDSLIPDEVDDRLRDAFEVLISIASPILYLDPNHLILSQLQKAALAIGGIRNFDEEDNTFNKAINILKSEIERNGTEYLILKSDQAKELFKSGGIEWVTEDKHAQSILRNYFKVRSETHHTKNSKIRGYKITKNMIDDLLQRYGGTPIDEKTVTSVTN